VKAKRAEHDLLITRTFAAPVSVVFALWSSAEHLKRWMGPANFTCPEAVVDFRVGGRYCAMIKSAEHGENWFGGVYREIEQDKRLVFTFAWNNDGPSAGVETLITITFEERNGQTLQTFHQRPFLSAERRDSHMSGWNETFDKQRAYVAKIAREYAQ
jgi:uncharacterized protein YndB with AHSA1/START domain